MPENNIKWHVGHTLDVWTYAAGKTLKYRLNMLAERVNQVCAVLEESKKSKRNADDMILITSMVDILYNAYFPALETNPYIPHLRANYERGLNMLDRRVWKIVNRENLAASSMMQEAMTSLGTAKRRLRAQAGGDAE